MKNKIWLIPAVFAIVHLAAVIIFMLINNFAVGGETRLLWLFWIPIDFPISLLVSTGIEYLPDSNSFWKTIRAFWPHIVHGILGTIWWFVIPIIILKVKREMLS